MNKYYHENDYIMDGKSRENVFVYITPEDEAVQSAASSHDDVYNVGEDLKLWIESIADYVLRNIRICKKYICVEAAKEYQLIYECSDRCFMDVLAILEDCTMVSMLAENIPCEEISEDDRDEYKEAVYAGEIVWSEFCRYVEKDNVKIVMDSVCLRLTEALGYAVRCGEEK